MPFASPPEHLPPQLSQVLSEIDALDREVDALTAGLSDAQANFAPAPGRWSILECIDHLNVAASDYDRKFVVALALSSPSEHDTNSAAASERVFKYGMLANWFIREMEPPPRRRFPAPKKFRPTRLLDLAATLAAFKQSNQTLRGRVIASSALDLRKIKVTSPASSLIRFPLGAAFEIMTAHGRRHLWQAAQVKASPDFPRA